jgi:DNA-binding protein HU-beta
VNKNDLIGAIATASGLSKTDADKALDGFITVISTALRKGEEVKIAGFGTYSVTERAASQGRNPRTGEPIKIPASRSPKFKALKGLKDAVATTAKPKAK